MEEAGAGGGEAHAAKLGDDALRALEGLRAQAAAEVRTPGGYSETMARFCGSLAPHEPLGRRTQGLREGREGGPERGFRRRREEGAARARARSVLAGGSGPVVHGRAAPLPPAQLHGLPHPRQLPWQSEHRPPAQRHHREGDARVDLEVDSLSPRVAPQDEDAEPVARADRPCREAAVSARLYWCWPARWGS